LKPILFNIAGAPIPSFFFMIAVATLATTYYYYWLGKKNGLNGAYILDIGMLGMIAAVVGGRIFHILVEAPGYYWEDPLRALYFWRGGFVSYGGFIGVGLCLFSYLKWRKVNLLEYLDTFAAAAPIVKFFIRVGCLLAGCCYGRPTDLPWAITFHNHDATAFYYYPYLPLHPTQIYSMIHALLLFGIVNLVYRRRSFPGQTLCVLGIFWTLPRTIIEAFRADVDRGVYFDGLLSTAQIVGGLFTLLFIILYFVLRKRAQSE
jgi:phosphatidylglycerol---prolipoprotein diacylglyceryl transferase